MQMMAPWPFAQWGLDILGSFPTGTRQMKFLVVGIDYFTKWVEAKPLAKLHNRMSRTSSKRALYAGLGYLGY